MTQSRQEDNGRGGGDSGLLGLEGRSLGMHLRTTNPIESTFAPVRARTDITKGPGSRQAGLAMIFKLMEAAEGRWRRLNGHHLTTVMVDEVEVGVFVAEI
jgi:hypothetical protein